MFTRIRTMHPLGLIAAGAVGALVLSGTAIAVTDTSFTYSTVQTGYLMIGPADLIPDSGSSANDYYLYYSQASSPPGACFRAPVHLPDGARMTSVRTSFVSGGPSNLYLGLWRNNPVTAASAELVKDHVVFNDLNTRTYVNDVVPAELRLVNNALYTYTYTMCVGSSDAFYGSRITYTYTNAGD